MPSFIAMWACVRYARMMPYRGISERFAKLSGLLRETAYFLEPFGTPRMGA